MNNIEKIRSLLEFDKDDFYFIQIIKRRKENPELKNNNKCIRSFYADSLESFDKIVPKVIKTCEDNNARAYIHLNRRNYKKISLQMLKRLAEYISNETYKPSEYLFNSICGEFHSENTRRWFLDIDEKLQDYQLSDISARLYYIEPIGDKFVACLETKSGHHIVVKPFNLSQGIDMSKLVHKDSPVLLYM